MMSSEIQAARRTAVQTSGILVEQAVVLRCAKSGLVDSAESTHEQTAPGQHHPRLACQTYHPADLLRLAGRVSVSIAGRAERASRCEAVRRDSRSDPQRTLASSALPPQLACALVSALPAPANRSRRTQHRLVKSSQRPSCSSVVEMMARVWKGRERVAVGAR